MLILILLNHHVFGFMTNKVSSLTISIAITMLDKCLSYIDFFFARKESLGLEKVHLDNLFECKNKLDLLRRFLRFC